jgi:hypothetical protein
MRMLYNYLKVRVRYLWRLFLCKHECSFQNGVGFFVSILYGLPFVIYIERDLAVCFRQLYALLSHKVLDTQQEN